MFGTSTSFPRGFSTASTRSAFASEKRAEAAVRAPATGKFPLFGGYKGRTLTVEQRAAGPRQGLLCVANALGVFRAPVPPQFAPSGQRAVQDRSAGDDVFIRGGSLPEHRAETHAGNKKIKINKTKSTAVLTLTTGPISEHKVILNEA